MASPQAPISTSSSSSSSSFSFRIRPLDRFVGKNSQIRRPKQVAHFSYDDQRQLRHDASSLRSYYTPELGSDLSSGFERFDKHDDSVDEHLDGLLASLVELEKKTEARCSADVITWRGMVTKFMTAPYDGRDGFEMNAIKFQDTIFIEDNYGYKQRSRPPPNKRMDLMSFWGYKFESLGTIPGNWDECPRETIESRDAQVVNNKSQFCLIVKTGFGDVSLIIGGEVDAVWDQNPPGPNASPPVYVELKTSKSPRSPRDHVNFERKTLRFWAQSFLLGVEKIVVGFRDDNGILQSLRQFETQTLPVTAKRSGRKLWDGKISIDFTTSLLEWIKHIIGNAPEGTFWRISHKAGSDTVELSVQDAETFISPVFLEWRNRG